MFKTVLVIFWKIIKLIFVCKRTKLISVLIKIYLIELFFGKGLRIFKIFYQRCSFEPNFLTRLLKKVKICCLQTVVTYNSRCNSLNGKNKNFSITKSLNNHECKYHAFMFNNESETAPESLLLLSWEKCC